jgi:hypothetical protein
MTLDILKQISIREYLSNRDIRPERENEWRGMFHSPLRTDINASFSVDYTRNVWFDHGLGEGGSIIDLISKLENCSIGEAIKVLENNSFSFHRNNYFGVADSVKQEPTMQIIDVRELTNSTLLNYLNERCIIIETARQYCKEVHYMVNNRSYFAVGFKNDSGGYDLRNKYFQGCISPKEITVIRQKEAQNSCYVFEGFMDFLSFLILRKRSNPDFPAMDKQDYIILNSVNNASKASPHFGNYDTVHCFLDNDIAGHRTVLNFQKEYGLRIVDSSGNYAKYKDVNDYLCQRPIVNKELSIIQRPIAQNSMKKKTSKGRRL